MSYDSLLLDFDGVVVNVLPDERRLPAFRERITAELMNRDTDAIDDSLVERLAHSVSPEDLPRLSERVGIDPEALWRARDDALADVLTEAARDGHKTPYEDVTAVSELDRPVGIVSNNQRRIVESISREFGLAFDAVQAREPHPDSLRRKKPEPTFLEETVQALGAEEPLFVGDKETDVLAGRRAGLDTVLIRRGHNADREVDVEPTYEVDGLDTVVELIGESPR
ncbi:HAD-IA family hydrolase [Halovenus sp. WSH3]|uniref:HAD-IA family hydrolase n=1 Tax=Halovenus carboxidivorans TaxID=2692199 RepID=A0A6B0TCG0_9EURY|nr:HAD-IA family hydrolase [Halovenus carboxidivorans]MXR53092.1 HAD-IA family hydrolase [Halovenus carboxidivorans]